jgi:hypothetical protein
MDLISFLLLHCIIVVVSLVLTGLAIYLYFGLSKVKNSHHLRDLR